MNLIIRFDSAEFAGSAEIAGSAVYFAEPDRFVFQLYCLHSWFHSFHRSFHFNFLRIIGQPF